MSNFKVGDVVLHKVGGEPAGTTEYTITALHDDNYVSLKWGTGSVDRYRADYLILKTPAVQAHATRVASPLPADSAERKMFPLCAGLLDYFPAALAAVSKHSYMGNEKHNPGQPLHWSRGKSADHLDALLRHVMERDLEGAAWRALAALQMQLEAEGAPVALGAREP